MIRSAPAALVLVIATAGVARADETVAACADAAERGQELRDARKLVSARRELVACAQRECPSAIREPCIEWLADVDRRMPSIVVAVKDEVGRDVSGASVTVDGAPLPSSVTSTAHPLDPGPHVVQSRAPGCEPAKEAIVLREGEGVRVVSLTLRSSPRAVGREPAPATARSLPLAVPIALGATSLVALGTSAYFGATGASAFRSLERDCAPDCPGARVDDVRTRFVVADVMLLVGVGAGLASAVTWLLGAPAGPRPSGVVR